MNNHTIQDLLKLNKQLGDNNVGIKFQPNYSQNNPTSAHSMSVIPYVSGRLGGLSYAAEYLLNNADKQRLFNAHIDGRVLPGLDLNAGVKNGSYANGDYKQNSRIIGLSYTPKQLSDLSLNLNYRNTKDNLNHNDDSFYGSVQYNKRF